jgi:hypothetical protein
VEEGLPLGVVALVDRRLRRVSSDALLGAFVQLGWPKIVGALAGDPHVSAREQDELRWWSERVLRGARHLE